MIMYQLSLFLLFIVFGSSVGLSTSANTLGTYNIDRSKISVSGISSGAYFAVQFHVAFSSNIMGVGVFAGGQTV
jgi:predicted peptidase